MKTITVNITDPKRLDVALTETLGMSRSKVQKAIKAGAVEIEGKSITPHFLLESPTEVKVDMNYFEVENEPSVAAPPLDILYEDDDILVINKPAGLLVHEAEGASGPTLVDSLLEYLPSIKEVGEDKKRPGIVHRIDREASGVLVVAKTNEAFTFLKRVFKDRQAIKHYTVLVYGHMSDLAGTINFPIERSKNNGRMAAKPNSQGGREAITHFDVIKRYGHHDLLDIRIETGRTHQIRAHMFAMDHPVVGDRLYKSKRVKPIECSRLFLHAQSLTIPIPSGGEKTFTATIPTELNNLLSTLPL